MPYRLRKAPKRDLYWVVGEDGTKHSKEPLPRKRAEAQMRALYAVWRRKEGGSSAAYERHRQRIIEEAKKENAMSPEQLTQYRAEKAAAHQSRLNEIEAEKVEKKRKVDEWNAEMRRRANSPFAPVMEGLTQLGDVAADKLADIPGIGSVASSVYKTFAPPGSKYHGTGLPPPVLGMGGYDEELTGEGFFGDMWDASKKVVGKIIGRVKDVSRGVRLDYSPNVRRVLSVYGDRPIVELYVRRDPILAPLNTALNFITRGKWNEVRQKYAYDKLFHLGLEAVVKVNDDSPMVARLVIEKNEVINVAPANATTPNTELVRVEMGTATPTINSLLSGGQRVQGDNWFRYDAFQNNCQDFIIAILKEAGLLTDSLRAFVKQPLEGVISELPGYTGTVARAITDLGAVANVAIQGRGGLRPSEAFEKQLKAAGIDPATYLKEAQKKAGSANVGFSSDDKHKLQISTPTGRVVRFGAVGLGDHILYTLQKDPMASEHRRRYLARATKIKGKWADDEYSPNSLAIKVLW